MDIGPVDLEKDIDGVLLQTGRNRGILMGIIFSFRVIKSFEMGINFEMLSNFEGERLTSKLEFVDVAIVINWSLFDDLKLSVNCLSLRCLLHSFE